MDDGKTVRFCWLEEGIGMEGIEVELVPCMMRGSRTGLNGCVLLHVNFCYGREGSETNWD